MTYHDVWTDVSSVRYSMQTLTWSLSIIHIHFFNESFTKYEYPCFIHVVNCLKCPVVSKDVVGLRFLLLSFFSVYHQTYKLLEMMLFIGCYSLLENWNDKYFQHCGPEGLHCSYSVLLLCINRWAWLWPNKTLFTETKQQARSGLRSIVCYPLIQTVKIRTSLHFCA